MSDITYSWNFDPLEVVYNVDGLTNVVNVVHWQFSGTTGSISNTVIGTVPLSTPDTGSFVAYDELTKEIVTGWVEGTMGSERVASLSSSVSTSIAIQLQPVRGTMTPPWI
jgi:hypothetical protein